MTAGTNQPMQTLLPARLTSDHKAEPPWLHSMTQILVLQSRILSAKPGPRTEMVPGTNLFEKQALLPRIEQS